MLSESSKKGKVVVERISYTNCYDLFKRKKGKTDTYIVTRCLSPITKHTERPNE